MNRNNSFYNLSLYSVPRTRGDEPEMEEAKLRKQVCSPHTRG